MLLVVRSLSLVSKFESFCLTVTGTGCHACFPNLMGWTYYSKQFLCQEFCRFVGVRMRWDVMSSTACTSPGQIESMRVEYAFDQSLMDCIMLSRE